MSNELLGARPLIDRPRSTSKTRPELPHRSSLRHPASNPSSPINSPYGSPTDSSIFLNSHPSTSSSNLSGGGGGGLKSALRNNKSPTNEMFNSDSNGSYFSEPINEDEVDNGGNSRGRTGGLSSKDLGHGIGIPVVKNTNLGVGLDSIPKASPSLPSTYSRRVGFDTFNSGVSLESTGSNKGGGTGVNYSFTISAKSAHFCRSKNSRTFLVGTDLNEYSVHALDWLLSSLTENNDEVVVLRVIEPGSSAYNMWREEMEEAREEAEQVLEDVMKKNGESRSLSIIVEFAVGPIEETIHRIIEIYKPDSLIVGTRGKPDSVWKSAFMGSISKYCVARSPVPVVVVRPEDKVKEALERRLQDPKKRSYLNLLKPQPGAGDVSAIPSFLRSTTAPVSDKRKSLELDRSKVDKEMKRFGTVG